MTLLALEQERRRVVVPFPRQTPAATFDCESTKTLEGPQDRVGAFGAPASPPDVVGRAHPLVAARTAPAQAVVDAEVALGEALSSALDGHLPHDLDAQCAPALALTTAANPAPSATHDRLCPCAPPVSFGAAPAQPCSRVDVPLREALAPPLPGELTHPLEPEGRGEETLGAPVPAFDARARRLEAVTPGTHEPHPGIRVATALGEAGATLLLGPTPDEGQPVLFFATWTPDALLDARREDAALVPPLTTDAERDLGSLEARRQELSAEPLHPSLESQEHSLPASLLSLRDRAPATPSPIDHAGRDGAPLVPFRASEAQLGLRIHVVGGEDRAAPARDRSLEPGEALGRFGLGVPRNRTPRAPAPLLDLARGCRPFVPLGTAEPQLRQIVDVAFREQAAPARGGDDSQLAQAFTRGFAGHGDPGRIAAENRPTAEPSRFLASGPVHGGSRNPRSGNVELRVLPKGQKRPVLAQRQHVLVLVREYPWALVLEGFQRDRDLPESVRVVVDRGRGSLPRPGGAGRRASSGRRGRCRPRRGRLGLRPRRRRSDRPDRRPTARSPRCRHPRQNRRPRAEPTARPALRPRSMSRRCRCRARPGSPRVLFDLRLGRRLRRRHDRAARTGLRDRAHRSNPSWLGNESTKAAQSGARTPGT